MCKRISIGCTGLPGKELVASRKGITKISLLRLQYNIGVNNIQAFIAVPL